MATKKIAEIIDEITDMEELVNCLRTMLNQVDHKRDEAVEIFGINISDILSILRKSTDYLLDLCVLYKDRLANTEIDI